MVTGASRGIGAATALAFAQGGDRVAIHYSASEAEASSLLQALPGKGHLMVRADLRCREEIRQLVASVRDAWGGIDVLINNAGVVHWVDVEANNPDEWEFAWDDTIEVNLMGTALVTWHALRVMGQGGRIVNVTSRAAFRGMPGSIPYAASKAAIAALSQSLAQAVAGRGISVTAIAPGYVETDMLRIAIDERGGESIHKQSPFQRVATADEVAQAIIFLAGSKAEWAAGAILDFNGASHLRM